MPVRRRVSESEFESLQQEIEPYAVARIRARVAPDSVLKSPRALLGEFVGPIDTDAELNAHTVGLQEPVTHQDDIFGTLTLNRRVGWCGAQAVWAGEPILISLCVESSEDLGKTLQAARTLWGRQRDWNKRMQDYAVEKLLPLKNDAWLDEGEDDVTPQQFRERMALEAVSVYPDGSFEFWHHDGDLFWGHSIQVGGSLVEGPTNADIPG